MNVHVFFRNFTYILLFRDKGLKKKFGVGMGKGRAGTPYPGGKSN